MDKQTIKESIENRVREMNERIGSDLTIRERESVEKDAIQAVLDNYEN